MRVSADCSLAAADAYGKTGVVYGIFCFFMAVRSDTANNKRGNFRKKNITAVCSLSAVWDNLP